MIDSNKLATMASTLRSPGRRYDPNKLSTSRMQELGDQSLQLSRALARRRGERPNDTMTAAEAAEVERIADAYAGQHGLPPATGAAGSPEASPEDREVARVVAEQGIR